MGLQVTVYGYNSYTQKMDEYKGARVVVVDGHKGRNTEMVSHMWLSSTASRRQDYDIVHIHSTDPCLLAWLPRSRYGVVATSHGQAYLRSKWSFPAKLISRMAEIIYVYYPKVITSVSKPLADYYFRRYRKHVQYIPNGIKMLSIPPEINLNRFGLKKKSFLFCSAGRIEKTKGLHTLLDAYTQMKTKFPLIIAGGGRGSDRAYFETLKQRAIPNVQFVGFLTGDALFSLYAHAAVFIFPSEYEAMSMALLEGLSFGTPTVYSDLPENREVADGIAFSFPVGNAAALKVTIESVLKNFDQAQQIAKNAMVHIRKHHDWKHIAIQYNKIYKKMVNSI
jgi:glycosyltransferase involved in cell wall biosynthesis